MVTSSGLEELGTPGLGYRGALVGYGAGEEAGYSVGAELVGTGVEDKMEYPTEESTGVEEGSVGYSVPWAVLVVKEEEVLYGPVG